MKFIQIILTVVITAAVVYYGLNLLSPHRDDSAGSTPASQSNTEHVSTSAGSGLTEDQARAIGHQVGEKAASEVVQSMGSASSGSGLTEDEVRRIARDEAEKVVAEAMARQASSSHETDRKPPRSRPTHDENDNLPAYVPPKHASASEPKSSPRVIPHPAAVEHHVATEQHAKSEHHTASAQHEAPAHHPAVKPAPAIASKPKAKTPPPADVLTTWWTPGSQVQSGQFALVYAGSAAFDKAIVLLFSNPVGDPTSAARSIRITDVNGKPVRGTWRTSAQNPRMLIFNVPEGRYDLTLDKGMTDAQGRSLGRNLHGPVYVR